MVELVEEVFSCAESAVKPLGMELALRCALPQRICAFDRAAMEQCLYQLLSNAIKYGNPDLPIQCWAERTNTHLLFRMRNTCADNSNQELLRAAFTRLDQRDVLPDPQCGMGIGLPLVLAIARLHGGMAAVEVQENTATVTVSIPLSRLAGTIPLHAPTFEYSGGMRRSMMELSDNLPNELFHPDAL